MFDQRIYDRVLLVENSDHWRNAIISSIGHCITLDSVSASTLTAVGFRKYHIVAIEFSTKCVEICFDVFDKMDLNVENQQLILLGSPNEMAACDWFRQVGVAGFIDGVHEIHRLRKFVNLAQKRIVQTIGWQSELARKLPWPEVSTRKQFG